MSGRDGSILKTLSGQPLERLGSHIAPVPDITGDGVDEYAIASYGGETPLVDAHGVKTSHVHKGKVSIWNGELGEIHMEFVDRGGGRLRRHPGGSGFGEALVHYDSGTKGISPELIVGVPDAGPGEIRCYSLTTGEFIWKIKGSGRSAGHSDRFGASIALIGGEREDSEFLAAIGCPGRLLPDQRQGAIDVVSLPSGGVMFSVEALEGGGFGRVFQIVRDCNGDGIEDIAAAAEDRYVSVFSGRDGELICRIQSRGGAAYGFGSSIAVTGGIDPIVVVGCNESVTPDSGFWEESGYHALLFDPRTCEQVHRWESSRGQVLVASSRLTEGWGIATAYVEVGLVELRLTDGMLVWGSQAVK